MTPDLPRRTIGPQPCLDQRDDGLGIEPASAVHQDLDVPAWVERTTVDGDDVAGIAPALSRRSEGLAGQCGGLLVGPALTIRKQHLQNRVSDSA